VDAARQGVRKTNGRKMVTKLLPRNKESDLCCGRGKAEQMADLKRDGRQRAEEKA
jgi:hypothetical protein